MVSLTLFDERWQHSPLAAHAPIAGPIGGQSGLGSPSLMHLSAPMAAGVHPPVSPASPPSVPASPPPSPALGEPVPALSPPLPAWVCAPSLLSSSSPPHATPHPARLVTSTSTPSRFRLIIASLPLAVRRPSPTTVPRTRL